MPLPSLYGRLDELSLQTAYSSRTRMIQSGYSMPDALVSTVCSNVGPCMLVVHHSVNSGHSVRSYIHLRRKLAGDVYNIIGFSVTHRHNSLFPLCYSKAPLVAPSHPSLIPCAMWMMASVLHLTSLTTWFLDPFILITNPILCALGMLFRSQPNALMGSVDLAQNLDQSCTSPNDFASSSWSSTRSCFL